MTAIQEKRIKVAHLTTVHPRGDTRVFVKECGSLAASGYEVTIVVADGMGDDKIDGVSIVDSGKSRNRITRLLWGRTRLLEKALRLEASIYHIHDPELIAVGLRLARKGFRVVFDAHEDVPKQILYKSYLPKVVRIMLSKAFSLYERTSLSRYDLVIAATPSIREKMERYGLRSIDLCNYPVQAELCSNEPYDGRPVEVCYVGVVSKIRGANELVEAMSLVKSGASLILGGNAVPDSLSKELLTVPGYEKVRMPGRLDRGQVRATLARARAGLVTLHPTANYVDSLPVKMFEYMAAGIPVIASNFPLWITIIEEAGCGLCVNPLDPRAIADAIDWIIEYPEEARAMGERGRKAVFERYNWETEFLKLLAEYERIAT